MNRYLLDSPKEDKHMLITFIKQTYKEHDMTKHPLIVVDGKAYRYDVELKQDKLPLKPADIEQIDVLDMQTGINIYGEPGTAGVLLVITKKETDDKAKSIDDSKVLFLIGDKVVTKEVVMQLNPDNIETIEVIKDPEKVKKYTKEPYDGVIIINLKKKE